MAVSTLALVGCTPDVPDADWPTYLGDPGRRHYSELTRIDATNVAGLEVAWRYDAGELQPGISVMDTSPLVVDGVLYGLSPTLDAFALDAATGEELWRSELADAAVGQSQRGLLWWSSADGEGEAKRGLYYIAGSQLVALAPRTGDGLPGFGSGGGVDLAALVSARNLRVAGPGVVAQGRILIGLAGEATENATNMVAAVLAIDAGDGSVAWTADLARFGERPSTAMAFDGARGLAFVSTESELVEAGDPVSAGLVALDATTGELRWRQSIYRRESWGGRLASPPTLVRFEREGQAVDAVALATRRGHLFLFDRDNGDALHPTVLQNGEPVSGLTFTRQTFTPSERQSAADATSRAATFETTPWASPTVAGTLLFPGVDAGAGWGGAAFEPATQRLILNVQETASILRLLEVPAGFSDRNVYFLHCARCHGADRKGLYEGRADRYGAGGPSLIDLGQRMSTRDIRTVIEQGRGAMPRFDGLSELERIALVRYLLGGPDDFTDDDRTTEPGHVLAEPVPFSGADRLPANAPPWGSLVAFDLNARKPAWQVPLGEYLSSPGLEMGAENTGGAVVTASGLIFVAATPDMKLRAFNATDGALLWESELSAGAFGTPAIYAAAGRQFITIAAGGGHLGPPSGSEYIAFALQKP